MRNNKEGGYVLLLVLVVIVVVVTILWSGKGDSVDEEIIDGTATTTTASETTANPATSGSVKKTGGTGSTASTLPTMTASGAYIIYYGTNGFSPASLSIPLGKSVHFVNNSSSAMLIVPVDKVNKPYSSLMQSKSVGKGGTFDYTFTASGSYAYYNDNKDTHVGVITVNK